MVLSPKSILDFHRRMYALTPEKGGRWNRRTTPFWKFARMVGRWWDFCPVSALATPEYVQKLCELYHHTLDEHRVEPLLLIASFVLDFECIHPFQDGNGGGRLLTLLLLYQAGFEVGRYISLERIVEESKETYYEALHRASKGTRPGMICAPGGIIFSERSSPPTRSSRTGWNDRYGAGPKEKWSECGWPAAHAIQPCRSATCLSRRKLSDPQAALADLQRENRVHCLGKGRDAEWERIGSWSRYRITKAFRDTIDSKNRVMAHSIPDRNEQAVRGIPSRGRLGYLPFSSRLFSFFSAMIFDSAGQASASANSSAST